jgi:transcriptional regulator with PAS, ATPase and Fis domain
MNAFDAVLVGESAEFRQVVHAAQIVAATDVSLMILGESGTGKDVFARAIHRASQRAGQPFVALNCAAIPESLMESELFGHKKGTFTGADRDRVGHCEAADGGTLFLDEIGELSLAAQVKLLRFLECREVQPLGGRTARSVDVRVVAATNADLRRLVEAGRFRKDLYYRLNVVPLELPPLRARAGDIPRLVEHFVQAMATKHRLAAPMFAPCAHKALAAYAWPGNVRELRNFCERMVVLFHGRNVLASNLPGDMQVEGREGGSCGFTLPETGIDLSVFEADLIRQALARTSGNRSRAARLLGISRDTLLYRLQKYAIEA